MWDSHPARLSLVHMLPKFAEARGLSTDHLLEAAGIAPEPHEPWEHRIVARAQISTLLGDLARHSGEPTIGLDLAASAEPDRLGLTGQAFCSTATLGEALHAHGRQMPSLQRGVTIQIERHGSRALWRHRLHDSDSDHARILNEGVAGFVVGALRGATGRRDLNLHVAFPHRRCALLRHYDETLRAGVSFGDTDETVVTFDASLLDGPNRLANLAAFPHAWPDHSVPEAGHPSDADLLALLRMTFESAALLGRLSLPHACRTIGWPPRSLQRRLARLGTSYEDLLDGWRQALARRHLAQSVLPIATIAQSLGYAHTTHFIRAFRRWEGITPSAYRQRTAW